MDRILTLEEAVAHAFIVDQVFKRLTNLWLAEDRVFLVQCQIHQAAFQLIRDDNTLGARGTGDIFWVEVTRDVDVAALKQQTL